MKKLLLTLTILSVSFCLSEFAYAEGFTNASLQGNYAFTGSAGSKAVVLGVATADGNGNFSAPVIQRVWNKQRAEVTLEGTYSVNEDGSGTMTATLAGDSGEDAVGEADFVIKRAEVVDGVKLATEIFAVQDIGFLGNPATFTGTRLPD